MILTANLLKCIPLPMAKSYLHHLDCFLKLPHSNFFNHFYLPTAKLILSNPTSNSHVCILTYCEIKWNEKLSVNTGQISGSQAANEAPADATTWERQPAAM